jgi:hypothetical protein
MGWGAMSQTHQELSHSHTSPRKAGAQQPDSSVHQLSITQYRVGIAQRAQQECWNCTITTVKQLLASETRVHVSLENTHKECERRAHPRCAYKCCVKLLVG